MKFTSFASVAALVLPTLVQAQLSGTVGPTTTTASKRTKVCNVLDYGGVASKTSDIGPPIASAFAACKSGGTVYVPPGDYGMSTWVTLSGGSAWAFQLDGVIYRVGTGGGNMIFIEHTTDFEFYSSTSGGAIQGNGYVFHAAGSYGPRLLRLYEATDFSVHDIALVDAPQFHLVLDDCYSGELYNMVIYGGYEGGLDGIDVWGENIWIHDIEVSNKDECVTVKSPAHNMLIEDIYCNISGGCAMGSLGADTNISNIYYRNVYTHGSNQMFMIKSWGGSGTVNNCTFENFIGHSNAYSLDFNAYWTSMTEATGDGVEYTDINFIDWTGTAANGVQRAPINVVCPAAVPCTDVAISDFEMWTDSGSSILYKCANAYGSGGCLVSGTGSSYTTTSTIKTAPTGYSAATMPNDLASGFPISSSIPIPTIATTYFPGATPISKRLGDGTSASAAASSVKAASSTIVKVVSSTSKKASSTSKKASSTSKKTSTTKAKASTIIQAKAIVASSSATTLQTSASSIFTTYADSVTIATTLDASVSASLYAVSSSSSSMQVVTQVSVVTVVPVAASTSIFVSSSNPVESSSSKIETETALGAFSTLPISSIPISTPVSVSLPISTSTTIPYHSNGTILSTSASESTTLTVYATSIYTITSCAASITNCPARASESTSEMVVTDVITLTTTVCPVAEAESASSEVLALYSATATAAGVATSATESSAAVETGSSDEGESSGEDDEDTCE